MSRILSAEQKLHIVQAERRFYAFMMGFDAYIESMYNTAGSHRLCPEDSDLYADWKKGWDLAAGQ